MQLPETIINPNRKITITRLLPIHGEVEVERGERVEALQVIARAERPSRYRIINVAKQLAQANIDMEQVMLKAEGEAVQTNEAIASIKGGLPFLQRVARAPVEGRIAAVGPGWVLLETERASIDLPAFINGVVTRVIKNRGVVIESVGAMISAACGFGGEAYGPLKRLVDQPFEILDPEAIDENVEEAIILGGRTIDEPTLRLAEEAHVRGIIVGSIDASLLNLDPPTKVRVVATEGFGDVPMAPYTFGILATTLGGKEVSIRGNTPVLSSAPNNRAQAEPPIILATTRRSSRIGSAPEEKAQRQLAVGSRVRIVRGQLLGASGTIDSIPTEPQPLEAGIIAAGAYVEVSNVRRFIPWANLERVT